MTHRLKLIIMALFVLSLTKCSQNREVTYSYCGQGTPQIESEELIKKGIIELLKFSSNPVGFMVDSIRIVGGVQSLVSKIIYPEIALRAGVEGIVGATFTVDTLGNANNIKLTKGLGAGCDEVLLFAIKNQKFIYQSNFNDRFNEIINILVRFRLAK